MIFDSHAHYDDAAFDDDRDQLLASLPQKGISGVVNAGTSMTTSRKAIELAEKYSYIYASVGVHPECIDDTNISELDLLRKMAENRKVVAIGEIGLDYHRGDENKHLQIEFFEKQVCIANDLKLPILVHDREAHKDTLNLLKKYEPKGVVHCFSGSVEMAEEILKLGMYIGVGGAVTFKNAKKIVEVVKEAPLERILLETDAPYMTPVPFRGKRCDSSLIEFTAKKIAEIRQESYEDIVMQCERNAVNLFNIGDV